MMKMNVTPAMESRTNVNNWMRMFQDNMRKRNLLKIIEDQEKCPKLVSAVIIGKDGAKELRKKVEEFKDRKREAFVAICEAMAKDQVIYNHKVLDDLRDQLSSINGGWTDQQFDSANIGRCSATYSKIGFSHC
jgi:hypothetical protein